MVESNVKHIKGTCSIVPKTLSRELGPVGMVRFLQRFETGHGDYSSERHQWLDQLSVDELAEQIKQHRNREE